MAVDERLYVIWHRVAPIPCGVRRDLALESDPPFSVFLGIHDTITTALIFGNSSNRSSTLHEVCWICGNDVRVERIERGLFGWFGLGRSRLETPNRESLGTEACWARSKESWEHYNLPCLCLTSISMPLENTWVFTSRLTGSVVKWPLEERSKSFIWGLSRRKGHEFNHENLKHRRPQWRWLILESSKVSSLDE